MTLEETPVAPERIRGSAMSIQMKRCKKHGLCKHKLIPFCELCATEYWESAPSVSSNSQSDEIIADIKEVVQSWFKCNDDLSHRECDILNSVVKCYKRR